MRDVLASWAIFLAIVFGIVFGIRACVFNEIHNNERACEAVNGVWVDYNLATDKCKYLNNVSTGGRS